MRLKESKKTQKPQKPNLEELTALRFDELAPGFAEALMEPQDPITPHLASNLEAYRLILGDDQVKATLQQRYGAVISREWSVEADGRSPLDQEAAAFVRAQLEQIDFDSACRKMLSGLFYGYAVAEVLRGLEGGRVTLADIRVRQPQRFRFDAQGRLWLLSGSAQKTRLPRDKFWTFKTGADDDDSPYGIGLAHWLYWPCYFKRNGLRAWLTFLDKFAMPTPVGRYDLSQRQESEKFTRILEDLRKRSALALPRGLDIELLEARRSGTADYATLDERMERKISKIILSQTMTTDEGASLAQGRVHEKVKEEVIKADADLICASFNRDVVAPLVAMNFAGARPPKVWRRLESEPDLKQQAERDALLFAMGYQPTQDYIDSTYGAGHFVRGRSREAAPKEAAPENAAPQEAKAGAVALAAQEEREEAEDEDQSTGDRLKSLALPGEERIIETIKELVFDPAITSLEELSGRLLELYPSLQPDDLATLLGQALALEELKGMRHEIA